MALQSLGGGLVQWPEIEFVMTDSNILLNGDGESFGAVIFNPTATTVRGFTVRCSQVVAAGDVRFRMETVSAGLPTGTLVDAAATVDVTVSAVGLVKGDFGADVTMPAGFVAMKVTRFAGSTFNGQFRTGPQFSGSDCFPPYELGLSDAVVQGSPAVIPFSGIPPDEVGVRLHGLRPCDDPFNGGNVSLGANAEAGVLVTVPFKARVRGLKFWGYQQNAPTTAPKVKLYSDDGETVAGSGDFAGLLGATNRAHMVLFDTPAEIAPGDYYIVVHGNDSTNPCVLFRSPIADDGTIGSSGLGLLLERTGSTGAFTQNVTKSLVLMALVLDQLDDGVQVAPEYPGLGHPIVGVLAQPKLVGVLA